jgi:uncharacterized NAD(P)/FAD-binding protein YdhS
MSTGVDNSVVPRANVAIVGGGFSGTTLAAQLLRRTGPSFSVLVVEKTSSVGRGLAYGKQSRSLLLNVRARNMSAFADDPHHFLRWAQSNFDPAAGPGSFLPREVYGRYVEEILREAAASVGGQRLEWLKDEALALAPAGGGAMEIRLSSGSRVLADRVVLALGNFPPGDPLAGWDGAPRRCYFRDPGSPEAFEGMTHLDSILLIGSGLTSVDVAIQLRAHGFQRAIHIVSRHGLLPQSHKPTDACPPFWNESSPRTTRALLCLVREQVRRGRSEGMEWQSVFDSLRPLVAEIWQSLPEPEKRGFLRHVRPYWEVHRHRAAPQIAKLVDDDIARRQIQVHAGRITNYEEDERQATVAYRNRTTGKEHSLRVNRVINCTGPETDCRRLRDPLVSFLLGAGFVRPDPLFLGLDVSPEGALVNREGAISESIYTVGPARKGNLWESTAVPELRVQVHKLVEHLLSTEGKSPRPHLPNLHFSPPDRSRSDFLINSTSSETYR